MSGGVGGDALKILTSDPLAPTFIIEESDIDISTFQEPLKASLPSVLQRLVMPLLLYLLVASEGLTL